MKHDGDDDCVFNVKTFEQSAISVSVPVRNHVVHLF